MRFLIGILTGTVLTLFIATAVDAPTQTTLNKASDVLSTLWKTLIDRTSDSLFTPPGAADEPEGGIPGLLARADAPTPADADAPPATPRRAAEPAAALAPPEELPPPPPVRARVAADASTAGTVREPARAELPATTDLPVAAIAGPPDGESTADVDGTGNTAGVWTPFHSQRSAQGFAAQLSRALDHDFRVERQGAGAYQVVFDVTSPDQRDALLTEIAELTGQ